MTAASYNPWHLFDFFKMLIIAPVISAQIAVETFYMYSAFFIVHKIIKEGKVSYFRIILRKYLRLAPVYYLALFAGWTTCAYYSNEPLWNFEGNNWYNCSDTWWHKILFVGNIVEFVNPAEGCFYWSWAI